MRELAVERTRSASRRKTVSSEISVTRQEANKTLLNGNGSVGLPRLLANAVSQQRPAQNQPGGVEVDDDARHVNQRRHKGGGTDCGVETQPAHQDWQHRARSEER